jgi:hypothetical protein
LPCELGFNSDWIEKCLAHEDGRSSRGIYNKVEYAEQRRHMFQEWADMIDAWVAGKSHTPTLLPPTMKVATTAAPMRVVSTPLLGAEAGKTRFRRARVSECRQTQSGRRRQGCPNVGSPS